MTGGDTISTDDLGGGVKVQRVKVQYGADGSATDVATGTPLPVTIITNTLATGAATSAKQDTGNISLASIDTKVPALGQALAAASTPVVLTAAQVTTLTPPAAITGFATAAKQPALGTAGTASADVITVQGKTSMTPLLVDPSGVTSPVSLASVPSHAVTNAGTFATQATLQTGSNTIGALTANQTVNNAQINGITPLMGNGVTGTGSQRVTVASDNTPFPVKIDQTTPGTTNLVAVSSISTSVTPGTGATNLGKAEDSGHTSGDVGVLALGVRNDTLADQTNTDLDYGGPSVDSKGRTIVTGAPRGLKGNAQVQLSNTTTETTIIAATASKFHDVYGIILANTGASTTKVSLRDDTAGTVRAIIEVPTLETRGFMLPIDSAIAQTAVNKNWTAQCGTATTALEVTAFYVTMV